MFDQNIKIGGGARYLVCVNHRCQPTIDYMVSTQHHGYLLVRLASLQKDSCREEVKETSQVTLIGNVLINS